MVADRHGDWMQTFTGRQFWPLDPRPDEIDLRDIAHALSMSCRYAGHVARFYSVGQHSVLVSRHVSPENATWGLLHDATEAYLVDVPRPVKRHLAGYREAEKRLAKVVAERFGLDWPMPAGVKRIDDAILADEKAALMGPAPAPWSIGPGLGISIDPWTPQLAEIAFTARAQELGLS